MAARPIDSGTITFGMVSIPFRQYTATREQKISFRYLHKDCGSTIAQEKVCKAHEPKQVLTSDDLVLGFEHTRDQFLEFTSEELKALENPRRGTLELLEFVPASTIDLLYIERSYYLGPDKGGERGFKLLAEALNRSDVLAVGSYAKRGKDTLVFLRAYRGGLLLHEAYYANEICPLEEVAQNDLAQPLSRAELDAARLLIETLERPAFEHERFHDEWAAKVKGLVEEKLAGRDVVVTPPVVKPIIIDLVEALKRSIVSAEERIEAARADSKPTASVVQPKGPRKAEPRATPDAKKKRAKKS